MPAGDPQFGEIWAMSNVSGGAPLPVVVADVGPHIITFVGMNGNRLRMPVGRLLLWNFMSGYPRVAATCQTPGCTHAGFLRFSQRGRAYFVCPRHLPIGVNAEIVQETPNDVEPLNRPTLACPGCDSPDPIENIGFAENDDTNWALLTCPRCPQRWITIWYPPTEQPWAVNTLLDVLHACERVLIHPTGIRMHPNMLADLRRDPRQEYGDLNGPETQLRFENIPLVVNSGLNIPAIVDVPTEARSSRSVQRLRGGTPETGGVSRLGGQPNRTLSSLHDGMFGVRVAEARREDLRDALFTEQEHREEHRAEHRAEQRTAEQAVATEDDTFDIQAGSAWVQRSTGNIMHVLRMDHAVDRTRVVVYCNKGEENEPAMRMVIRDFLANHRAYVSQEEWPTIDVKPVIEITSGEEWEFTGTPSVGINIIAVDHKKEVAHVEELESKRKRTISFSEFIQKRWRKVVRKTAYQWLLDGEGIDGDDA
jgi:hypothetical protein